MTLARLSNRFIPIAMPGAPFIGNTTWPKPAEPFIASRWARRRSTSAAGREITRTRFVFVGPM
jgi:hypothetical protein